MIREQTSVPYLLETERLLLRAPVKEDAPEYMEVLNSTIDTLKPWKYWIDKPQTLKETEVDCDEMNQCFKMGLEFHFFLIRKSDQQLIGVVDIRRTNKEVPFHEIGYWLHKDAEGNGYAVEAVERLKQMALECMNCGRIEIRCDTRNLASIRVAERTGFTLAGTLHRASRDADGKWCNMHIFEWLLPVNVDPDEDHPYT